MKTLCAALLTLIGLLFSVGSFADCYSCTYRQSSCNTCNTCVDNCSSRNQCACTEPSCGKNPCLSRAACCRAFGNVGAYEEE